MTPTLIGRTHPAATLRAEIARAQQSHGGLVLVTGEAGIGKTTLVTEAMAAARQAGILVVSGSCWDSDSAPGYWPWTQVIRALRRAAGEQEWRAAQEAAGVGLAVLLGEASGEPGPGQAADPDSGSFRIFDAVTTAIVSVSQHRPLLVVLDDLHWADAASLRLLEFAAQHTWFERVLLVGTYRDVEVETAAHPLRPLMVALVAKATTITLTGLDPPEVAELMSRTTGTPADPGLVAEVHRRTGGNPFFVEQTARLWHSGASVTTIAPGVRDALSRRLSLLPPPVTDLLTTAAVLGREFQRQVLAATVAQPAATVDRMLDQAAVARLVSPLGAGRFSFAHDLVRETLYDTLDERQRQARHAAVVQVMDLSPALAEHIFAADLARHAFLAGPRLDPDLAVDKLLAAAADAGGRLAVDEAIGHYRRALDRVRDPARKARITMDLGRAISHTGDREAGWLLFEQAAALADEVADPELWAWMALIIYRHGSDGDAHTELRRHLLRTAHQHLIGGAPGADVDKLAQDLIVRTEMLARSGHDDEALKFSLWARHDFSWGPGTAREREALTAEMEVVGRRSADTGTEAIAASFRWVAMVEMGDPRYLEQVRSFVAIAERDGSPRMRMSSMVDQAIIATATGRFDEAQTLLSEVDGFGEHGHSDFSYMGHHLRWALLMARGHLTEADELLSGLDGSDHPYLGLTRAITAVELGDASAALRFLGAVERSDGQDPYPRTVTRLWLRLQAQLAAATGDPALCERVREALTPYRGEWAVSLWGCDISGPLDLWLAQVDAAQQRWDGAIAGFTAAADSADRMRARPWSVRSRLGLARALAARSGPGDADASRRLLDQVRREAAELGMKQITEQVRPPAEPGRTVDELPAYEFRRENSTWCLRFAGQTVHMPDAKGLHDLHLLLSRPGVDLAAVEMVDPGGGAVVVAAHRMGGDPILDDEAKAQYKRRLDQLDAEIDSAAERDDVRRLAVLESERRALLDELRSAAGLAGRSRRLGDEAERARKTVTARIRDSLRRLGQAHPALAEHLRATVTTGASCRYAPPAQISWRL